MISCRLWRTPARSAGGPAGRCSICSSKPPAAQRSAPRPATSRATRAANTCSTTAGPTPTSAPAAATIRSCRSPRRSRRRPAAGCWCAPGRHADDARQALAAGCSSSAGSTRRLRRARHLPDRGRMALPRRARLSAAHRPAVPLGERRLRDLRRFPRRAVGAQAQDHPPRAARRAGQRPRACTG